MEYNLEELMKFKRSPKVQKQSLGSGLKRGNPMLKHKINLVAKISNNGHYRYIEDIVYVNNNNEKYIVINRFVDKVHNEIDYNNDFVKLISCNGKRIAWNR